MIERLARVTTAAARGRDDDEPLAPAALERAGVAVDVVDRDDADVRRSAYDRAVLRSTWDYPDRLPRFHRWRRTVHGVTDLRDPPDVVEWNVDKHDAVERLTVVLI